VLVELKTPAAPKKSFVDFQGLTQIGRAIFRLSPRHFRTALSLTKTLSPSASTAFRQTHFRHPLRTYMERTIFSPQLGSA
jgi:hypothetical protein